MAKGKNVLTTGDVAKICNVAPRTVSKWFDSGQLKGYRIPGSKDRRIPVNELIKFMKSNNMPTDALAPGKIRVLVVDSNLEYADLIANKLKTTADYKTQIAQTNFQTGLLAHKFAPHVIAVNLLADQISASDICSIVKNTPELETIKILAIAPAASQPSPDSPLNNGFDGYIDPEKGIEDYIEKIEQATAIIY